MLAIEVFAYKCGMTQFFTPTGIALPVSVIKVYDNYIIDIKEKEKDILNVKIAACHAKSKSLSKSIIGLYKKIGIENLKYIKEFTVKKEYLNGYNVGDIIPVSLFHENDILNIIGTSKGKGFAGTVKRHNFSMQRATHGNSLSHRVPGSIGQCQDPGKVFKGKKMSGRLGGENTTIKNISIVKVYNDMNVILLKGGTPGFTGNKIILKKLVK